jgi:hypothetical protein
MNWLTKRGILQVLRVLPTKNLVDVLFDMSDEELFAVRFSLLSADWKTARIHSITMLMRAQTRNSVYNYLYRRMNDEPFPKSKINLRTGEWNAKPYRFGKVAFHMWERYSKRYCNIVNRRRNGRK